MTVQPDRFQQVTEVLWRRSLDGVILLPVQGSAPVSLSGSGVDLWQLLEEPHSLDRAAQELAERFGMDPAEMANEIGPIIEELVEMRLVESVGP